MVFLLVDDSRAMRMILKRYLTQSKFDGSTILEAENGVMALQIIEQSKPDMIIADWNMPEMSGYDLLLELGKKKSSIPFGFVTSEGTPEMRQLAEKGGALFLIAKPFTQEMFIQTIMRYQPHDLV